MMYSARTEQGYKIETCGDSWRALDFDGLILLSKDSGNLSVGGYRAARYGVKRN